jgi:alpha-L-fucosidase
MNLRRASSFAVLLVLVPFLAPLAEERSQGDLSLARGNPSDRTAWYREAKFGMFIHWGAYSLAGVEASWPIMAPTWFPQSRSISERDYVELPKRFNPTQYDAQAWVQLAKQAGMRYMVMTSKHHDGFCMFDAPGTDYKITNTPFRKDIIGLLAAACKQQNMPLGLYYSPPDMHHPGFRDISKPATENWMGEPSRSQWPDYLNYMESHLRVLLTGYGPIAIIWFDGLFGQKKYDPARFHRLIHDLSPRTLINDRLGPGGDYVTPEQFTPGGIPIKRKEPVSDISPGMVRFWMFLSKILPQRWMAALSAYVVKRMYPTSPHPTPEEFQLWETCMTINDTWAYNPEDRNFKSATRLIRTLVEVASRGGNFLLNVGPTPEGTIQAEFVERLVAMGEWLKVNGESIYGTTYGPLQNLAFGRSTAKGNKVYLHVFDWPKGSLKVPGLQSRVAAVTLLAGRQPLKFRQAGEHLTIEVPALAPDPHVTVLALEIQ